MSFLNRLSVARIDAECEKTDDRDRSEAAFRRRREGREKESKAPPRDASARWSWAPPGGESKGEERGAERKADDDVVVPIGSAGHRFYPRERRSRAVVARALEYWRDYWKQFDDPEMMELFDFESHHYREFDPDVEEHSLAHTALHREYRALFERVCANHIVSALDTTPEDFSEELRRDLHSDDADRRAKASEFLDIVHKADDFEAFAESMKAAVRQARWLEEPD